LNAAKWASFRKDTKKRQVDLRIECPLNRQVSAENSLPSRSTQQLEALMAFAAKHEEMTILAVP
jgi:hypothetical protein